MVHVESSAMTDVDYDGAGLLRIRFADGDWYRYFDVPPSVAAGLQNADSRGRYFQQHIRDRYRYERE